MSIFKATEYVPSVFEIDYQKLKKENIKLICFDLDNTLDYPDQEDLELTPGIEKLINDLKKEFHIYIVSNNEYHNRVKVFADYFNLEYKHKFRKPFQKNYVDNTILSKYTKEEIVFVGDKIVTDIIGANRYGSHCILVDPLYEKDKMWYAKVMGLLEKMVRRIIKFPKGKYYGKKM